MVDFQFVGDVSDLCDVQRKLIINVIEERGFKNVNIDIQPVGKAGENSVATVNRITVEKDGETFKIIAKVAPKNDTKRDIGSTTILFQNEHVMYTQVLPKFTELENAANIPEEERLRYAACYGTYMEAPNEIILLEDLEVPGFKILDRFTSFKDEHVRLVLKNFASLHSLSYALKYQEPETFKTFTKSIINIWFALADIPGIYGWYSQIDADVQIVLDDDKYKNSVKNATVQLIPLAAKLAKTDSGSKHSVIQQGDSWTNNIMFRLEDNRTVESCMIDYQASRQSSPVADLHYMIFNCTDHCTRMKYYYDWIDYYHSQLDKSLANFGLKINNVYPRDQLDADLKRFAKFSLGQFISLTTFKVRELTEAAKVMETVHSTDANASLEEMAERVKLSSSDSATIKKFRAKVEGVVDSFIEFGYL